MTFRRLSLVALIGYAVWITALVLTAVPGVEDGREYDFERRGNGAH